MSLEEMQRKVNAIRSEIEAGLPARCMQAGRDLVALVSNRVTQKGENKDGSAFSPYSRQEIPAFFYFNRSRTDSAERKVRKAAKQGEPISYFGFRQMNNLNADKKIFEFTGEMWRSFDIVNTTISAGEITVTIGGRTGIGAKKMLWNSEQEGVSIIEPSKSELALARKGIRDWAQKIIDKNLA